MKGFAETTCARFRFCRFVFTVAAFLVLVPLLSSAQEAGYQCIRVVDGDTIRVAENGTETTLRLVGIDAPEKSHRKHDPGQPFSQAASRHLAALVLNKPVEVRGQGTDRYGRVLAVVFAGGKNVNLEMVKAGFAEVYRGKSAPGMDMAPYWKAEEEARDAGRGIWALKDKYVNPRQWRAKQKSS